MEVGPQNSLGTPSCLATLARHPAMPLLSKEPRLFFCCSILKSHLILCDHMDCSMPDFPVLPGNPQIWV